MPFAIRVTEGEWGDAGLTDIEAVARSAAGCFAAVDDEESIAIALEPTAADGDSPWTSSSLNERGEFVVQVNVRGRFWARLAYQFAHEFCHVLADPRTWVVDRFAWIEEALCETASLFALRSMARTWAVAPPFENWREYATELTRYESEHVASEARSLAVGLSFTNWLSDHIPLLVADHVRRDDNTIVAQALLPVFERDPAGWRAVRSLHDWPRPAQMSLADFMSNWANATTKATRHSVESIAGLMGATNHRSSS